MGSRLVPVNELVTVDDIAVRLKMSINSVSNIVRGRDGRKRLRFPQPLVGRGTRAVWLWEDVEAWYDATAPKSQQARQKAGRAAAMTYRQQSWSQQKIGHGMPYILEQSDYIFCSSSLLNDAIPLSTNYCKADAAQQAFEQVTRTIQSWQF